MKVAFYASAKEREENLADAFLRGCNEHSVDVELLTEKPEKIEADVVCMVGVKSRELWRNCRKSGVQTIYFDKSYSRTGWNLWRVSINAHHPTDLLAHLALPSDRFERLNIDVQPWRRHGAGHVVFAGSSAKYHEFYSLPGPTRYAARVIKRLRKWTEREVVYRPKPSWQAATPISGSRFSQLPETMADVLVGAHALVTHGSNACFEALIAGIPSVVLGDGVVKPISTVTLDEADEPRLASEEERFRLLYNVAYFQWSLAEMQSGEAWQFIKEHLPVR